MVSSGEAPTIPQDQSRGSQSQSGTGLLQVQSGMGGLFTIFIISGPVLVTLSYLWLGWEKDFLNCVWLLKTIHTHQVTFQLYQNKMWTWLTKTTSCERAWQVSATFTSSSTVLSSRTTSANILMFSRESAISLSLNSTLQWVIPHLACSDSICWFLLW